MHTSGEWMILKGLEVLDLVRVKRLNYSQIMAKVSESSIRLNVIIGFLLAKGYIREVREGRTRWFEPEEKGRKVARYIIGAKHSQ
jgi:predicted transcriptional regulator